MYTNERWKRIIIDGFKTKYKISDHGRVKSLVCSKPRLLHPVLSKAGYLKVNIRVDGILKGFYVHRLVQMFFSGDFSEDLTVDHLDGNKTNNYYINLENVSNSENVKRAFRTGLSIMKGEKNSMSKFTEPLIHEICDLLEQGFGGTEINEKLNVGNIQLIYDIKSRNSWTHISKKYNIPKKRLKKRDKGSTTIESDCLIDLMDGYTLPEVSLKINCK